MATRVGVRRTAASILAGAMLALCTTDAAGAAPVPGAVVPARLPDTPAGRRLADWLAVFNRGDEDQLRSFIRAAEPTRPEAPDFFMDVRGSTGPLDLFSVGESSTNSLTVVFAERNTDSFDQVAIDVDPADPRHILRIEPRPVPRPAGAPPVRPLKLTVLGPALRARLEHETAAGLFSGAVMIARNGRPVFAYAGGYADRSRHVRNTLHTGFDLASMGKMFTIVAIAQLADAGKVDFKAPLSAYLPDYPNKGLADRVTIEELLTHTGGTGDIFTEEFERRRASLRTLDDYIALFGARDPAFEPGSRRAYSNYGFILLGKVVEKVSGENYGDYLVRHIYRPAGMEDAGLLPKGRPPRVAIGYTLLHGKLTSRAFTLAEPGTSAGGGYASVFDMVKFAQALRDGRLMRPDRFTALAQGAALIGGKSYRYDFGDKTETGVPFIGHSGGNLGVSGDFRFFSKSGYTLVVLTNFGPPWQKIGAFVSNRLPVGPLPAP